LNHDLGPVGVERRIGAGLDRAEKFWRGEFVRLLAVVFEMQAISDAARKGQLVRGELVFRRDYGYRLRRIVGGDGRWKRRQDYQQRCGKRRQTCGRHVDRSPSPPPLYQRTAATARVAAAFPPMLRRSVTLAGS